MEKIELKINEKSIKAELRSYKDKPFDCLCEYIWNSFDANATQVQLCFDTPKEGIGNAYNVKLIDNGHGWDFEDDATTNNFMSSTKKPRAHNTLPKGQHGRGRYAFIWIAEKLSAYSKNKKLTLQSNTDIIKEDNEPTVEGTEIKFEQIRDCFSDILLSEKLHQYLAMEFGWFLLENNQYKITVNKQEVNVYDYIKETKDYDSKLLKQNKIISSVDFTAKIVLWRDKPSEYSKFYFLDNSNKEISKINTGLNKKGDDFWHSVYFKSSVSNEFADFEEDTTETQQKTISFEDENNDRIKKQIINYLKEELFKIRKPYLVKQSDALLQNLKEEKLIPDLIKFGVYDEVSYGDLIKTIYTISPSLFTNKSKSERKFICATFAGLLSNQDHTLIKVILEQLQILTDDEQKDLLEILKRTTLSNIIKTIKEIDHRLEVIDKLKILISEHEKKTLEVEQIQQILDQNFWLFGEQFRLFSSTEGALKNVLVKYAKEILDIKDPILEHKPNGEVDLFLTKTECSGDKCHHNIIVEIKRASIKLGKSEYNQIESYMEKIITENLCNGENQNWEFYLIGKEYDEHINNKIESSKNHGEKSKGLCFNIKDGRVKIYVRKWSDILEVEWGAKMKYLKDKLQLQAKKAKNTPFEITKDLIDSN